MHVEAAWDMSQTIPVMELSLTVKCSARKVIPVTLFFLTNVIRLMAAGRIDTTRAITSVRYLDEAASAIAQLAEDRSEGKVMIALSCDDNYCNP